MANYHIQMKVVNDEGDTINMLPVADAKDVIITTEGTEIPSSATSLQDVLDLLGKLAFKDEIDEASLIKSGIVTLSNSITDTSVENKAATTKAVSLVNINAVHIVNDEDVNGVKTFKDGININNSGTLTGEVDSQGNKTIYLSFD